MRPAGERSDARVAALGRACHLGLGLLTALCASGRPTAAHADRQARRPAHGLRLTAAPSTSWRRARWEQLLPESRTLLMPDGRPLVPNGGTSLPDGQGLLPDDTLWSPAPDDPMSPRVGFSGSRSTTYLGWGEAGYGEINELFDHFGLLRGLTRDGLLPGHPALGTLDDELTLVRPEYPGRHLDDLRPLPWPAAEAIVLDLLDKLDELHGGRLSHGRIAAHTIKAHPAPTAWATGRWRTYFDDLRSARQWHPTRSQDDVTGLARAISGDLAHVIELFDVLVAPADRELLAGLKQARATFTSARQLVDRVQSLLRSSR
jgi:hypothetical protein